MLSTGGGAAEPLSAGDRKILGLPPLAVEALVVVLLLTLFCMISIAVAYRSLPFTDEVMCADASINVVTGRGRVLFTNSVVLPGERGPDIAPAFGWALASWLSLWGTSRAAVLSFNAFVVALSTFCLWAFTYRWPFVQRVELRLSLVAAIPLLPALYRFCTDNRYDSIGMLALSLAALSLTLDGPKQRRLALFACGLLGGLSGLHVVPASGILACLAALFLPSRYRIDAFWYLTGLGMGLAGVLSTIVLTDQWNVFRALLDVDSVRPGTSLWAFLAAPLKQYHSKPLLAGTICLWAALLIPLPGILLRQGVTGWRSATVFGLFVGLSIPIGLTLIGRYSFTYVWMAATPMFVCAVIAIDRDVVSRPVRLVVLMLLLLATLPGLPATAVVNGLEWQERDYTVLAEFVQSHIQDDDIVYAGNGCYYPVRHTAREAYFGSAIAAMTAEQMASVTVAFMKPILPGRGAGIGASHIAPLQALGGDWHVVDRIYAPRGRLRMQIPPPPKNPYLYDITVYRRAGSEK